MRFSSLIIGGLIVVVGCGGGGGGGGGGVTNPPPPPPETLVHAARVTATAASAFIPGTVSIPARDSIFFTFESTQHSVIFDSPGSPSGIGNTNDATVKRAFPTAGTYNYHCGIHAQMTGTVTVTP